MTVAWLTEDLVAKRRTRKMATTTPATTTPRKTNSRATKAVPKAAVPAEVEETDSDGVQRVGPFELRFDRTTKSYEAFDLKTDIDGNATGCVGTVYAPLGTTTVKVVFYGPNIEE